MLKTIVQAKQEEVMIAKQQLPVHLMEGLKPGSFELWTALLEKDWSLIAECKLVSPVKGMLCSRYTVPELAQIYATNGAAALSVLTDRHFGGTLADLTMVRAIAGLPVLRKDFIIDSYQLFEARNAGADAVLLIAGILSDSQLREYLAIARELGLDCLVEVHDLSELERVQQTPARLIGINNRNLHTFVTDIETTFKLLPYCDNKRLIISESGVQAGTDVIRLKKAGVRGALVGEGLVRAEDIGIKTAELSLQ